jgi:hypothetical protein
MFTVLSVRRYTRERLVRSIHFIHDIQIVDIHFWSPGERLRVVFAVTDQFAKEHRTPPLLFPLWLDWPDKDVATAPFRIAVAIREKALSPEHRDVATRLENYRRYCERRIVRSSRGWRKWWASHWSSSPNSKNFTASLSPTFHGRSFGTIQENSKRSPTSSGNGSGGITFANVIETLAQLRG